MGVMGLRGMAIEGAEWTGRGGRKGRLGCGGGAVGAGVGVCGVWEEGRGGGVSRK